MGTPLFSYTRQTVYMPRTYLDRHNDTETNQYDLIPSQPMTSAGAESCANRLFHSDDTVDTIPMMVSSCATPVGTSFSMSMLCKVHKPF